MKVSLIGFQGAGKTTLFSAITGLKGSRSGADVPGVVKVPDIRIDRLSEIFKPKKTIYAEICFEDTGRLAPDMIQRLRTTHLPVFVIDNFSRKNPLKELKDLEAEFTLTDIELVEKRLISLKKESPGSSEIKFLERVNEILEGGGRLIDSNFNSEEIRYSRKYNFFGFKQILIIVNSSEGLLAGPQALPASFKDYCAQQSFEYINLCARLEKDISEISYDEQAVFLSDYNLKESAKALLVRKSYELQGLISFITVGKDEVRAWTVARGTRAKQAAGKIHSDLERGFIRAEVVSYDTFMECGGFREAKAAGKLRVEGKDYIVQDGEILNIRFNV